MIWQKKEKSRAVIRKSPLEAFSTGSQRVFSRAFAMIRADFFGGRALAMEWFVVALSSFGMTVLFANTVSADIYGSYRLVFAISETLLIFGLPGLYTSLVRSSARGYTGMLWPAFRTRLSFSVVGMGGGLVIAAVFFILGRTDIAFALMVLAFIMPIRDACSLVRALYHGRKQYREKAIVSAVVGGATLLSVAFLVVVFRGEVGLVLLVAVSALAGALPLAFFFWHTMRRGGELPLVGIRKEGAMIRYGKHLSIMQGVSKIAFHADKIIIFFLLGPVSVAIYSIAIGIPEQIRGFSKQFITVLLPIFSTRGSFGRSHGAIALTHTLFFLGVGVLVVFVYIIVAPILFSWLFPAYASSAALSRVAILSVLAVPGKVPLAHLEGRAETRALYAYHIGGGFFLIVLLCTLIPFFGLLGAVTAVVVSRFVNFLMALGFSWHRR